MARPYFSKKFFRVPLILAALIHTFTPGVLNLGSFTSAIFSAHGLDAMIGLQLFFIGKPVPVEARQGRQFD